MKELKNGLLTGLTLQLAVGPVFFFIINLVLQKTIYDGFAGVLAVTLVDYFYITLSIIGIGKILQKPKIKKVFGIISSLVLSLFGLITLKGALNISSSYVSVNTSNIFSSFISVFLLTISSPLTIIFFTSLFATKALEYKYTKKQLLFFGLGTGLATLLFMSLSVVLFYFFSNLIPSIIISVLNGIVGCLLVIYGSIRLIKSLKTKP
jgi:threonine/homoserine/homoserine lactone efflux protein